MGIEKGLAAVDGLGEFSTLRQSNARIQSPAIAFRPEPLDAHLNPQENSQP